MANSATSDGEISIAVRPRQFVERISLPPLARARIYDPARKPRGLKRLKRKLARVAETYAKRLQIQEKLTAQIANCVNDVLQPSGVAVVIEASHQCMTTRGVHKPGVSMVTSRMLGTFRDNPETRREFLAIIGEDRSGPTL